MIDVKSNKPLLDRTQKDSKRALQLEWLLVKGKDQLEKKVLDKLRHNLMDPDLFNIFCEEYIRETNQLHRKQSGKKAAQQQQLSKTEDEIAKLIDALKAGISPASIKDELSTLEQRKETLTSSLTELPPEQLLLHPSMVVLYRAKITRLQRFLESSEKNYEALDLIRSLVSEITLMPVNGELKLDLKGELANILNLCRGPKSSQQLSEQSIEQLKLVAGVGFEPTTFRL